MHKRISEIGVQEIWKSENLEPEIAVFEKAENGNLNARKLSATEIWVYGKRSARLLEA